VPPAVVHLQLALLAATLYQSPSAAEMSDSVAQIGCLQQARHEFVVSSRFVIDMLSPLSIRIEHAVEFNTANCFCLL
jgi:hypothetical protein